MVVLDVKLLNQNPDPVTSGDIPSAGVQGGVPGFEALAIIAIVIVPIVRKFKK